MPIFRRTITALALSLVALHPGLPGECAQPMKLKPQTGHADPTPPERYPAIDAMEKRVFGQSFTHDFLEVRLARLEFKVYGKTSPELTLNERTDNLRDRTGDRTLERELIKKLPPGGMPALPPAEVAMPMPGIEPVLSVPYSPKNLSEEVREGAGQEPGKVKDLPKQTVLEGDVEKSAPTKAVVPVPFSPDGNFSRMAAVKSQIKPMAFKLARRAARQAARRAMKQFLPVGVSAGMRYIGPAKGVYSAFVMAARSKAFNPP